MTRITILTLSLCFSCLISSGQALTSSEVLEKSIAFHDPQGLWLKSDFQWHFKETRPQLADRVAYVEINLNTGHFLLDRNREELYKLQYDSCVELSQGRSCERGIMLRNYYTYLWGLPMKLKDPGTQLNPEVVEEQIMDIQCYKLKVTYPNDTWYYYFRKSDFALIAYKFYKDEENGKGELILTDGFMAFEDLKFPNRRTWFELPGNKELGTDILEKVDYLR